MKKIAGLTMHKLYEQLLKAGHEKRPPLEKWNPPLSGNMDMEIRRDGSWWHEGTEIKRDKLVKLFSKILKKEGDEYFLVSPVEKWRIRVEDVPFIIVAVEFPDAGSQPILFETHVGDVFPLDEQHPLVFRGEGDASVPYVTVRKGLMARVSRNVFYELVAHAQEEAAGGETEAIIESGGCRFLLGKY